MQKIWIGSQDHQSSGSTNVSATGTWLTYITVSTTGTVFSKTGVTESGWTVTSVIAGDVASVAETANRWYGIVQSTSTNTLVVQKWLDIAGREGTPANGSLVTVHRLGFCKAVKITASSDNTQRIYVGLNDNATTGDIFLDAGESIIVTPDGDDKWVDVTRIKVISASGTQVVEFQQGVE
jgi:hypothetical protein